MNSCVFAEPADVVTLLEACLDQLMLLAAAGVDQNVGFEGHYQGMAANPENKGGDEFHQQQLRDTAAAELRLQEREHKVKAREDRVEAREAELDLLLEAARAFRKEMQTWTLQTGIQVTIQMMTKLLGMLVY